MYGSVFVFAPVMTTCAAAVCPGVSMSMEEERRQKKHSDAEKKGKEEARRKAMVARLARRPWRRKREGESEMKTVEEIRRMKLTTCGN